jgi:glycosyltransferase involved in cell wall biosynthesis
MACGTPVVSFHCGSVPEVIEEGISGVVVDSRDDALHAIDQTRTFNRPGVRMSFERRFTAWRMASAEPGGRS